MATFFALRNHDEKVQANLSCLPVKSIREFGSSPLCDDHRVMSVVGELGREQPLRGRRLVMVRRCLFWSLTFLVVVGSRPTLAGPITFTGNVQQDFSTQNIAGNLNSTPVTVMNSPLDLGEASFIPANGWVSGWAINNVQMSYSSTNDTMYVGLAGFKNSAGQYAIFGDADGNGEPGSGVYQDDADGRHRHAPTWGETRRLRSRSRRYNATNPSVPALPR